MPQKTIKRYSTTGGFSVSLVKQLDCESPHVSISSGASSYAMTLEEAGHLADSLRLASLCFATEFEDLIGELLLGDK